MRNAVCRYDRVVTRYGQLGLGKQNVHNKLSPTLLPDLLNFKCKRVSLGGVATHVCCDRDASEELARICTGDCAYCN